MLKRNRKAGVVRIVLILATSLFLPIPAFANNPGGFTTLVTTPVTTGTEAFGSRTDRYLDNGIRPVTPPTTPI